MYPIPARKAVGGKRANQSLTGIKKKRSKIHELGKKIKTVF